MKTLLITLALLLFTFPTFGVVTASVRNTTTEQYKNFEIVIDGSGTSGVAAGQFDVYFDPNVIEPMDTEGFCSTADTIASMMSVVCNGYESGRVRVTIFGPYPITESEGTILRLGFRGVSAGKTPLDFDIGSFWAFNPARELESSWENGLVSVE